MAAAMGRPQGPPRFQCPPDFYASRFAPGAPFSLETLQDPSKCLILIRAPADFSPESLEGHAMPLSGSQTLKVPQTDGTQKVYSIQATPGASDICARLLVPSGDQDQLACAPPFSGSLSIWERFGDPSANPALFPVADRQAPQIPEGLKQRFVPFGGRLKRPALGEAAEKPPQKKKKKKKRHLKMVGYMGDPEEEMDLVDRVPETPLEESTVAAGHWEGEANHHKLKNRMEENGEALCEQDSQPSSSLLFSSQESLFSEQVPSENIKKKKKKKKKLQEEVLESKDLLGGLGVLTQSSEPEPGLQSEFDTPEISSTGVEEVVRHKHKKKKKKKKREEEASTEEAPLSIDLFPIKEEAMSAPWEENGMGSPTKGTSGLVPEELGLLGYKSKKKKKKEKKEKMEEEAPSEQAGGTMLLESPSVKKELKDWDALASSFGEGLAQSELLEPTMEMPSQKHKKKKKKEHKKEAD